MDPWQLALAVLVPALCAGLVLGLGWKVWRGREAQVDGRWSSAPALALGYCAAALWLSGPPASFLPGAERAPASLDWLFWLVIGGALLFPFEQRVGRWRDLARVAFAVFAIELVLKSQFQGRWEGLSAVAWLVGLALIYNVLWAALVWLAARRAGASAPLVAWLTASALAVLAALSGSAKLGQLAAALAAGLGAATLLAWWRPRLSLAGGGAGMVALLLFGLGANAHVYSYTLAVDVLLVASAPLCACLAELPHLRRSKGWARTLMALGLAALPIAIALVRATLAFEPDPYADGY